MLSESKFFYMVEMKGWILTWSFFSVANISHAHFIAHLFGIPIKDSQSSVGLNIHELYYALAVQFAYIFVDVDTAKSFALRTAAVQATKTLGQIVKDVCEGVKDDRFAMLKDALGLGSSETILTDYGTNLIKRLFEGGKSVDEVVWTIVPTAAAAVATQAQGVRPSLGLQRQLFHELLTVKSSSLRCWIYTCPTDIKLTGRIFKN